MKYNQNEITNVEQLKDQILALKVRSERQKEHLQNTFMELKDSVKPLNLLKQVAGSVKRAGTNNDLVQSVLGLGGGMAARRLFFGKPKGISGKLWSAGADLLLQRLGPGFLRSNKNGSSPFWLKLLSSGRKVIPRIILGKNEAHFDPALKLLPVSGSGHGQN